MHTCIFAELQRFLHLAAFGVLSLVAVMPLTVLAGEPRGFAVSWFHVAGHHDPQQRDCPNGLNPSAPEFYTREFKRLGYTPAQIEEFMDAQMSPKFISTVRNRGMVDGELVDVYANPETVTDPRIMTVQGSIGRGFNLDGAEGTGGFTDPDSGERGVDNNLYRVLGCNIMFIQPKIDRPAYPTSVWNVLMEAKPAHLIEIRGIDDSENDDDIEIGYYTSLDHLVRGPDGEPLPDLTMRVDPDPRWRNVVRGKIKDGVLTTEVFDLNLLGEPWWVQAFQFKKARMRLEFKEDGTLVGLLGAYHAWYPFYWQFGSEGWAVEGPSHLDLPGTYYALKRLADADPDPKTGQNASISTAYEIVAVTAFVSHGNTVLGAR